MVSIQVSNLDKLEGLRIAVPEIRWAKEELKFFIILLSFTIVFPIIFGGTATEPGIRLFIFIPLLPIQAVMIDRIIFLYNKQSAQFIIDRNKTIYHITRALKRERYHYTITHNKKRYPSVAIYQTLIFIKIDSSDVRLYLKDKVDVTKSGNLVRELPATQIYIGPIKKSRMEYINKIKCIIREDLI